MTANRRSINDLRYIARNNLIIPDNIDICKNSTVSKKADSLETDLRVHDIVRNFAASIPTSERIKRDLMEGE